jgi:hypothetical protein
MSERKMYLCAAGYKEPFSESDFVCTEEELKHEPELQCYYDHNPDEEECDSMCEGINKEDCECYREHTIYKERRKAARRKTDI